MGFGVFFCFMLAGSGLSMLVLKMNSPIALVTLYDLILPVFFGGLGMWLSYRKMFRVGKLWIISCFVISAYVGYERNIPMFLYFGGLGLWLVYLSITGIEREIITRKKMEVELEKKRLKKAQKRFGNLTFVLQVLQDLQQQKWRAVSDGDGCRILEDKIEIQDKTYIYMSHGLDKLDGKGCYELAVYLRSFCPYECEISEISHFVGGRGSGYSGYIRSDGSASVVPDVWGGNVVDGYCLRKKTPKSPAPPKGMKW